MHHVRMLPIVAAGGVSPLILMGGRLVEVADLEYAAPLGKGVAVPGRGKPLLEDWSQNARRLVRELVSSIEVVQHAFGRVEVTNIADREQVGDVVHVSTLARCVEPHGE